MASKGEDDFWNTSSSSGFNFDDEEDSCSSEPFQLVEESNVLPIHSIISKSGLDSILDDIKTTHEYVVTPVEETIKKMFHGQKYVLYIYKRLDDKLLLLDSALETFDGNIIINVIIFLKNTLRQNIFFHQLSKRKMAVKIYANYLIVNNNLEELANLYMASGNMRNMKDLYYLIGRDVSNKQVLIKRLEQFMGDHLQKLNSNEDKSEIFEYIQLLMWQIENNEKCDSIIEQLTSVCIKDLSKNSTEAILDFKKRFKIDDFAFEWTLLNVMANMELWKQLENYFIKPNWLTKKSALKSVINAEVFVFGLSRHKPPKYVLEQYLNCITDSDKSLVLAQKLECHKFVIQSFINQRDRLALLNYKGKVGANSEEHFLIENALLSVDKKWKN